MKLFFMLQSLNAELLKFLKGAQTIKIAQVVHFLPGEDQDHLENFEFLQFPLRFKAQGNFNFIKIILRLQFEMLKE